MGTPGPVTPPPPFTPTPPAYDYSTDPGLAAGNSAAEGEYQGSIHGIDARRRAALLNYGSRALAMKSLGLGADDPFIQSIDESADTGTGQLARLAHAYGENQRGADDAYNKQNLFYSSARVKGLSDLAYAHGQQVANAEHEIGGLLEGLTGEQTAAATHRTTVEAGNESDAHDRALAWALQHPQAHGIDTTLASVAHAAAAKAKPKPKPKPRR